MVPWSRVLGGALAAAVAGCLLTVPVPAALASSAAGPAPVSAAELPFDHPSRTLSYGTAREAGLVPKYVEQIGADIRRYLQPSPTYPMYAGAVVLAAHEGTIVSHEAAGYALRYADSEPTELPRDEWIPARKDTIFDLASVTKLFTSIAAVQQVEKGRVDLDASVAAYLPEFAQNGKGDITIRHLLTHTSGLPAWLPLYSSYDTPAERIAAVYAVEPLAEPDTRYLYSDLNLITLGKVVEEVTGQRLDEVVAHGITEPLGMTDTGFNPPASKRPRIAATEYQPWTGRGMVWGSVHDENAWSLGGVAGHAGIFSTAHDLAILAQTILNGGRYGSERILDADSVRALLRNENTEFPGNAHGLGFELDQRWYMDALSSPLTAGHTGYTGTSLVIDPLSDSFVILLTNRVHPSREWGGNNPARRAVARDLALALPVAPKQGPDAWFSGVGDARTATLTVPVTAPEDGISVDFQLWWDTEAGSDVLTVEASTDGGTSWRPLPLTLRSGGETLATEGTVSGYGGRSWWRASADGTGLAGDVLLRWRYDSDALYQGRGVYVDAVRIAAVRGRVLFNGRRPADADRFLADGWTRSAH